MYKLQTTTARNFIALSCVKLQIHKKFTCSDRKYFYNKCAQQQLSRV